MSRLDWWLELTGRHPGEVEFLLGLSEELPRLDHSELIRGIGYTPVGGWQPLVLLDAALLGIPPANHPLAPAEVHADLSKLLLGPLANVPDALLLPIGHAESLSGTVGAGLVGEIDSPDYGTQGLRVLWSDGEGDWRPGFLTAGHAVPGGQEVTVVKLPRRRFARQAGDLFGRRWARRLGTVVSHNSPPISREAGSSSEGKRAGFDFAVVNLEYPEAGTWNQSEFTSQLSPAPQMLQHAERLAVIGGVSGYVDHTSVNGALFTAEDRWKDCWMLGPTSALQQGDSGAPAFVHETGEPFGMVVGATVGWGQNHQLFVQSLERLMANCVNPNMRILVERTI